MVWDADRSTDFPRVLLGEWNRLPAMGFSDLWMTTAIAYAGTNSHPTVDPRGHTYSGFCQSGIYSSIRVTLDSSRWVRAGVGLSVCGVRAPVLSIHSSTVWTS